MPRKTGAEAHPMGATRTDPRVHSRRAPTPRTTGWMSCSTQPHTEADHKPSHNPPTTGPNPIGRRVPFHFAFFFFSRQLTPFNPPFLPSTDDGQPHLLPFSPTAFRGMTWTIDVPRSFSCNETCETC